MPLKLLGGAVTISAGETGEIKLEAKSDFTVSQLLSNSTGRCEVTKIDIPEVLPILDGVIELAQLRQYGNVYILPESILIKKGSIVVISLRDISGASNLVYIALVGTIP